MPQIAGLRGVLPDPAKLKDVVAGLGGAGIDVAKGLAAGTLVRDAGRAVYRYHQVFSEPVTGRALVRKMVVCTVRLEPWKEPLVRPHEATPPAATAAALAQIRATKLVSAPVFAGYRDPAIEIDRLFRRVDGERPTLEATTPDHTVHRLWRVQSAELIGALRHQFAPKKLCVLDGHDRYEALLAYRDELGAKQPLAMYSSANYALSCLVNLDDPTLIVVPRHRVVRGAAPSQAVLAAARKHFVIDRLAGAAGDLGKQLAALADTIAHQPAFVVTWAGEPDAWKLTLSPDVSAIGEGVQVHRALQRLDPIVADQLFVARTMPDAKLEAVVSPQAALAAKADAVILMRPLTVEQISHVVELGEVIPAGSTAFHPPLATGLVSAIIDPDEDLV
ncbi:MAG: DUF1015 domain-containing protein [Deltaproteobacteria bacterium]|nr:MAG: DUF1015 domain-containing protein [Deltaproteobacteria bacterium]